MGLDKLKKLLESREKDSDIYESTLNQIVEGLQKELISHEPRHQENSNRFIA
jgi:hypothetical protein